MSKQRNRAGDHHSHGAWRTRASPASHPAPAPQVDDRLAGEGTGKILGINDPALFWAISIVFTTVWGVFYVATR